MSFDVYSKEIVLSIIMFHCISRRFQASAVTRSASVLFSNSLNISPTCKILPSCRRLTSRVFNNRKDYWVPPEVSSSNGDNDRVQTFRDDFQGTRVFVEGIPKSASWQDVKDHFRLIGEVVYASVSVDSYGESKGCGIVQYETVDDAKKAIKSMRDHPMDGSILYVRSDRQERGHRGKSDEDGGYKGVNRSQNRPSWRCGNEDNSSLISDENRSLVEHMIIRRDKARFRKDFEVADKIREELKFDYGVHLDDRLKLWWNAVDGKNAVPDSVVEMKGSGSWDDPKEWRQIPTTPDNDLCVNSELVSGLLKQRDIARREKDFRTADMLLEQARNSPDGNLTLRIHDESRTWRVWTTEPPPKRASSEIREASPRDKCIAYIREVDPDKEGDVISLLDKFPGREWNVLKKLRQRYNNSD